MQYGAEWKNGRIRLPFHSDDAELFAIMSTSSGRVTIIGMYEWRRQRNKLSMFAQSYLASRGGAADIVDGNLCFDEHTRGHLGEGPFRIIRYEDMLCLEPLTLEEGFEFYAQGLFGNREQKTPQVTSNL